MTDKRMTDEKLQSEIMKLELAIGKMRDEQNRIIVGKIREIQKKWAGKDADIYYTGGKIDAFMVYDEDGYRCELQRGPKSTTESDHPGELDELEELLLDYSYVFAGIIGAAGMEPADLTMDFE